MIATPPSSKVRLQACEKGTFSALRRELNSSKHMAKQNLNEKVRKAAARTI